MSQIGPVIDRDTRVPDGGGGGGGGGRGGGGDESTGAALQLGGGSGGPSPPKSSEPAINREQIKVESKAQMSEKTPARYDLNSRRSLQSPPTPPSPQSSAELSKSLGASGRVGNKTSTASPPKITGMGAGQRSGVASSGSGVRRKLTPLGGSDDSEQGKGAGMRGLKGEAVSDSGTAVAAHDGAPDGGAGGGVGGGDADVSRVAVLAGSDVERGPGSSRSKLGGADAEGEERARKKKEDEEDQERAMRKQKEEEEEEVRRERKRKEEQEEEERRARRAEEEELQIKMQKLASGIDGLIQARERGTKSNVLLRWFNQAAVARMRLEAEVVTHTRTNNRLLWSVVGAWGEVVGRKRVLGMAAQVVELSVKTNTKRLVFSVWSALAEEGARLANRLQEQGLIHSEPLPSWVSEEHPDLVVDSYVAGVKPKSPLPLPDAAAVASSSTTSSAGAFNLANSAGGVASPPPVVGGGRPPLSISASLNIEGNALSSRGNSASPKAGGAGEGSPGTGRVGSGGAISLLSDSSSGFSVSDHESSAPKGTSRAVTPPLATPARSSTSPIATLRPTSAPEDATPSDARTEERARLVGEKVASVALSPVSMASSLYR